MLKKQAGKLQDGTTDADELFAKGASVKLLTSKPDVGSKELTKVSIQILLHPSFPFFFGRKLQPFCPTSYPRRPYRKKPYKHCTRDL